MDNTAHTTYWLLWLAAATTLAISTYHPLHLGFLTGITYAVTRTKTKNVNTYLALAAYLGATAFLINALLVRQGTTTLAEIPPFIPLLAGPITLESLAFGCAAGLMLAAIILAFGAFSENVSPDALIRALPRSFGQTATALAIGLRFTPAITTDARAILAAQRSRGLRVSTGPVSQRMRGYRSILTPLYANAFERAHHLAESLESRGYSQRRSRYAHTNWHPRLLLGAALALASIATVAVLSATGAFSYWPYDGTPMPPPDMRYLAACVALLSPLITKP